MTRARNDTALEAGPAFAFLFACSFLALLACGCGGSKEEAPAASLEATLIRERVAHWFRKDKLQKAREEIAPMVASKDALVEDLLRAAKVEFALSNAKEAEEFLARAQAAGDDSATLHFLRGKLASEAGDPETALAELSRAHELAPSDLATTYIYARALMELEDYERAEPLLRGILAVGIENGNSWYVSALHALDRLFTYDDRVEEGQPFLDEFNRLKSLGWSALDSLQTRLGSLGRIEAPEASGSQAAALPTSLSFEAAPLDLPQLAGALELRAQDMDGDGRMDLVARKANGIVVALHGRAGWKEEIVFEGDAKMMRAFDLDNEPDAGLELLVVNGGEWSFFKRGLDGWNRLPVVLPSLASEPHDIVPVDFDHEGDMDLLLVGEFGAKLWRNDGAWVVQGETKGAYVDATETATLPQDVTYTWAATEDFDGDNDVDLIVGGPSGIYIADSLRAGRFADVTAHFSEPGKLSSKPLLADFNGDGFTDIFALGTAGGLWIQGFGGKFAFAPSPTIDANSAVDVDLDCDGALDFVWGARALLAIGTARATVIDLQGVEPANGKDQVVLDANGDKKLDIVRASDTGVKLFAAKGERGNSMPIILRGNRTNKRGVGSIVEVRSGTMYRRVYYRGEPEWIGVGEHDKLDVVRITYPNGITESELDVPLNEEEMIDDPDAAFGEFSEPKTQTASCPFLYTWNGETYVFITDVLGITPLGLPMAPGMMVPPDHDEFVLVTGEQLREQDGLLKLQITEELREVTYLDRIRLDVVDHPENTEIYPNELFKFPPFPEEHLHSVEAPVAVKRAIGSDGVDWTHSLQSLDEIHALPFEQHPPQFQGLAKPWFLELDFDPERVRNAKKLRLVMTGWFFWSNASANMAAAGHPGVDFVPPMIEVPDGEGGWRPTGPPVGFPAGKTKTMVIDVTELGLQETPRLRISCTLMLSWDRIVLAVDDDDAPCSIVSLEPITAKNWRRGFSEMIATNNPGLPERFDWERLDSTPRWNPHPGLYTKFGECHSLLHEVDDRFVILGTGEALEVHFDASPLPPVPEGYRRDYLVYFDGWAKDRDPNTLEALNVEPLPFHGMSGYPYTAEESFPDGEVHRKWRQEWNTREPELWLERLAQKP